MQYHPRGEERVSTIQGVKEWKGTRRRKVTNSLSLSFFFPFAFYSSLLPPPPLDVLYPQVFLFFKTWLLYYHQKSKRNLLSRTLFLTATWCIYCIPSFISTFSYFFFLYIFFFALIISLGSKIISTPHRHTLKPRLIHPKNIYTHCH